MIDVYPLVGPLLRRFEPETAHALALRALRAGLAPRVHASVPRRLATTAWGLCFTSPVGVAAGFDKNAEVTDPLLRLGFGFVEVGTVTPRPQVGNPRPRVFRCPDAQAMINRLGFNNHGATVVAQRLRALRRAHAGPAGRGGRGRVAVNIGCNATSSDPIADYVTGARWFAPLADLLVVNVSSPNTPNLRRLQAADHLDRLLPLVLQACRDAVPDRPVPVLLKVAPDLDQAAVDSIADAAIRHGIDGLVVSNTTVDRPSNLPTGFAAQTGGLSGRPLMAPSTRLLAAFHRRLGGHLPLVGVGGIAGPEDAYAKVRAGARLLQVYTALVFQGPGLLTRLHRGLAERLNRDGFSTLADAVGVDSGRRH